MVPTSISFAVRRYRHEAVSHAHPHHQIVLPIRGRLNMEVGSRADDVSAERAAVIPAAQPHSFAGSRCNAFLIVDVAEDDQAPNGGHERLWDAASARPFIALDRPLQGLCGFLAAEAESERLAGLRARLAGDLLLEAFGRRLGMALPPVEPALIEAKAFMHRHAAEPITVDAVARAAGLSISRLHALFRARFGISPKRYLASCRLARAARLLERSRLPVAEIALAVGYGDQSAFTRAFRREFGLAPAAYRALGRRCEERHKIR